MVKRSTFGAQSEYNSIGKRQSLVASDGEPSPIGLRLEQYETISPLSLAAIGSNPGMSVFEEKIIPSNFFFSLHRKTELRTFFAASKKNMQMRSGERI